MDSSQINEEIVEKAVERFIDRCKGCAPWLDPEEYQFAESCFRAVIRNERKADDEFFLQLTRRRRRVLQKELVLAIAHTEAIWVSLSFPDVIQEPWFIAMSCGLSKVIRIKTEEMPSDLSPEATYAWLVEKELIAITRLLRLRILGKQGHFASWLQGYNLQIAQEILHALIKDQIVDMRPYASGLLSNTLYWELQRMFAFYCLYIKKLPLRVDKEPWLEVRKADFDSLKARRTQR